MALAFGALGLMTESGGDSAWAQKSGGVLRMPIGNSPASMSIHEEATRIAVTPIMAVFNNLVIFDQHVPQNTFESIRPELADSWSWDEDKTALTFTLRQGVRWHDGKPFTARDVKCTWDMLAGRSNEKLRVNPRRSWYRNLAEVTVNGERDAVEGDLAIFARTGDGITVKAKTDAKLLVMDGQPIPEQVVGHGPFVMNSRAEIQQAFEDYQLGKMDEID